MLMEDFPLPEGIRGELLGIVSLFVFNGVDGRHSGDRCVTKRLS